MCYSTCHAHMLCVCMVVVCMHMSVIAPFSVLLVCVCMCVMFSFVLVKLNATLNTLVGAKDVYKQKCTDGESRDLLLFCRLYVINTKYRVTLTLNIIVKSNKHCSRASVTPFQERRRIT